MIRNGFPEPRLLSAGGVLKVTVYETSGHMRLNGRRVDTMEPTPTFRPDARAYPGVRLTVRLINDLSQPRAFTCTAARERSRYREALDEHRRRVRKLVDGSDGIGERSVSSRLQPVHATAPSQYVAMRRRCDRIMVRRSGCGVTPSSCF